MQGYLLKVSTAIGVHNLIESKIRLFQNFIDYSSEQIESKILIGSIETQTDSRIQSPKC